MPFNMVQNNKNPFSSASEITVTASCVVELLSIFHTFIDDDHKIGKEAYFSYLNEYLDDEDKTTIRYIHKLPFYGLQIMLLILNTKEFNNIEVFLEKVEALPLDDFVYFLSGELLSVEDISSLRISPDKIKAFAQNNQWIANRNGCSFEKLMLNPEDFKEKFIKLFRKLNNARFKEQLREFETEYSLAKQNIDIFLINNGPMDIIDDFKNFDRTKSFEKIIFIPALMMSPHRTYYFYNENTLMILYDPYLIKDYVNLQIEKTTDFLKTISDTSKLTILMLLRHSCLCSSELAKELNLTTSTISRHIDSLMKFGLITESKEKITKYYTLNPSSATKQLDDILKLLALR